jgi:putative mRNA 3-end processing factor
MISQSLVLKLPALSVGHLVEAIWRIIPTFTGSWMLLRGASAGWIRGFVMSDHADWPGLQSAIGHRR